MLRETKRMWGDIGRHHVFNLQHDGVAAGLAAGVSASTAASEVTYIETRALRMGGDGVDMVVSARHMHMGAPPHPFDTYMLSDPAEAQWILRTDPYAPDEEGGEARPDARSGASTAQLTARMEAGCAARKQARRAMVRCAQAGLRVGWPALAATSAEGTGAERDPAQPTMEEAMVTAAGAPAIPAGSRLVLVFHRRARSRRRVGRAEALAAHREVRRALAPHARRLGSSGRAGARAPTPADVRGGEAVRVWMARGSLSGGRLDPVGERIVLDFTAARRRAERAQRERRARRDELLRRVRLGAEADDSGRWQVLCLLDVARPEVRRGAQLWVLVRWQGEDAAGEPWADSCVSIA